MSPTLSRVLLMAIGATTLCLACGSDQKTTKTPDDTAPADTPVPPPADTASPQPEGAPPPNGEPTNMPPAATPQN